MKTYWGVKLYALPQGKSPLYPLSRRVGGSQSQFGCIGKEKILAPTGNQAPVIQPIA